MFDNRSFTIPIMYSFSKVDTGQYRIQKVTQNKRLTMQYHIPGCILRRLFLLLNFVQGRERERERLCKFLEFDYKKISQSRIKYRSEDNRVRERIILKMQFLLKVKSRFGKYVRYYYDIIIERVTDFVSFGCLHLAKNVK